MITKEVGQMVKDEASAQAPNPQAAPATGTALRKCKVCDTYSPADRLLEGSYCSEACRTNAHAT